VYSTPFSTSLCTRRVLETLIRRAGPSGHVITTYETVAKCGFVEQIESFPHHRYISFPPSPPRPGSIHSPLLVPVGSEYNLRVVRTRLEDRGGANALREPLVTSAARTGGQSALCRLTPLSLDFSLVACALLCFFHLKPTTLLVTVSALCLTSGGS
jgi:hypothetical protein